MLSLLSLPLAITKKMEIDELDKAILNRLLLDARTSYQEMGQEFKVSTGTIHVRLQKLKDGGIILGSKLILDFQKLGQEVCSFIGVNLRSAGDYQNVLKKMSKFPEITEVHYTTGQYSMFIKVYAKNTRELHLFLTEKLQTIQEVQSTETLIALDSPVMRDPHL